MQSAVGFIGVDIPRPSPRTAHGAKLYRPRGTGTERPKADTALWRADPDVVLMEQVRDGDMEAFQVLFTKYSDSLVKFAYRFLGSRARAEEVAQTTLLQIFRTRERYKPKSRFATFLYRIASNACLNEIRRFDYSGKLASLDVSVDPDSDGASYADWLPDDNSAGPARQLACREIASQVKMALEKLPPNQRMALLLSRVDGFSYQEVADTLETSVSAVKSLVFRATAALRRDLGEVIA
jgi:RNA polymerase sigma-70 factor (ECF subfamily)